MNREQIIQMAQEVGFDYSGAELTWESVICTEELERFAKLVAEHERSECVKFCDEVAEYFPSSGFVGSFIGNKIRDRGQA
jgi:hypothetical protein